MGAEDEPSVHDATRDWSPQPVEHHAALQDQRRTLKACLCMINNCSATNTWDEKTLQDHHESADSGNQHKTQSNGGTQQETRAMVVLDTKLEQWWYSTRNSSNGGTQHRTKLEQWWYSTQDETRAMVVLNRRNNRRNSSNGGTQQNETQRDDMRDNQTCVKSGLRPRIRRGSSGYRKNGSGC